MIASVRVSAGSSRRRTTGALLASLNTASMGRIDAPRPR
jgi:hypothetical protein